MPNIFQDMKFNAYNVVTATMGVECSWTPSQGGDTVTGEVLINNPTEDTDNLGVPYDSDLWYMEYKSEDLPGLFDAVITNTNTEEVIVNSITYYCSGARKLHDGDVIKINLIKKA